MRDGRADRATRERERAALRGRARVAGSLAVGVLARGRRDAVIEPRIRRPGSLGSRRPRWPGLVSPVIGYRLYAWSRERMPPGRVAPRAAPTFLRATSLALAVTEGVALFGIVALLGSAPLLAALIGVVTHVILAGAVWPTPERLESFLEPRRRRREGRRVSLDDRPIFLVGFMGSGKTEAGAGAGPATAREFVDTDASVVEREGRSIDEIFRRSRARRRFRRAGVGGAASARRAARHASWRPAAGSSSGSVAAPVDEAARAGRSGSTSRWRSSRGASERGERTAALAAPGPRGIPRPSSRGARASYALAPRSASMPRTGRSRRIDRPAGPRAVERGFPVDSGREMVILAARPARARRGRLSA